MTPRTIRPMLAETASEPFDSDAHWFEVKWDGFRAILFWKHGGSVRLQSRNLHDLIPQFPEFDQPLPEIDAASAVLDGEVVIIRDGRLDFQALLARGRSAEPSGTATYVAFDLLYLNGASLLDSPYAARRERLAGLLRPSDRIILCKAVEGSGRALFDAARERGLEGVVAKRSKSRYVPGRRSPSWLKVKHTHTVDAVIGGYAVRDGHLASLVLGVYPRRSDGAAHDGPGLQPLGQVGSGMSEAERTALLGALRGLRTDRSPFSEGARPPHASPFSSRRPSQMFWVRPILVCRVEALERTSDGRLRHPVFRGLRSDKEPEECQLAQTSSLSTSASHRGEH